MKDGGPAFPQGVIVGNPNTGYGPIQPSGGLSLRDYFAAAALQGYRSAYWQWYLQVGATGQHAVPEQMATWAYADADAMIRAREQ